HHRMIPEEDVEVIDRKMLGQRAVADGGRDNVVETLQAGDDSCESRGYGLTLRGRLATQRNSTPAVLEKRPSRVFRRSEFGKRLTGAAQLPGYSAGRGLFTAQRRGTVQEPSGAILTLLYQTIDGSGHLIRRCSDF